MRTLRKFRHLLVDAILAKKGFVSEDGKRLFSMRDYSRTTSMRLRRFFTKEPETLRWIDGFAPGSVLLDIGANVGSYSLYAACRGHRAFALEPDALNFALLNLNIFDNAMNDRVMAYPFAIHNRSMLAELNMSELTWGGSHKSFDRAVDFTGAEMRVCYKQGSAGISVDDFVRQTGVFPTHIKLDVDGNELLVLEGASETLRNPTLESVLVELCEDHREYADCTGILLAAGFTLTQRGAVSAKAALRGAPVTDNHIFTRSAS